VLIEKSRRLRSSRRTNKYEERYLIIPAERIKRVVF